MSEGINTGFGFSKNAVDTVELKYADDSVTPETPETPSIKKPLPTTGREIKAM
jgi:hypothetical protein